MKVVLFDVGDTLVYRTEDSKTIELNFLKQFINPNDKSFERVVSEKYEKFQENLFTKSTSNINSLEMENDHYGQFVTEIVRGLDLKCFSAQDIKEIVKLRFSISLYHLYVGMYPMLQHLYNSSVQIGIATNGKPSRREVLKTLGINRFINKELVFISDEIRFKKPDFDFFNEVTLKINTSLKTDSQIFLVDDDLENCKTASNFPNWRSIHFYPEMNITKEILGVIL